MEEPPTLPPVPLPVPVTIGNLETLAAKAGAAFEAALARFAKQEQQRWVEERDRLQEHASQLRAMERKIQEERDRFEEEKRRFCKPGGTETSEMVTLNVGGEANVAVTRSTLTQCEDSMLAAAFSGRWEELPQDSGGRVYVDFAPILFLPLLEHLKARRREEPGGAIVQPPASFEDPLRDEQFIDMLRHYRMLDWVYRQAPVEHQLTIGDFQYSVLPPQSPDTSTALTDMRGVEVTVPRGWQVLQHSAMYFELVIRELTKHGWGAGLLLVRCDDTDDGFDGYRTRLSTSGAAGSRFTDPPKWFQVVNGRGRTFKFAGSSYRLVIRSQAKQAVSSGFKVFS